MRHSPAQSTSGYRPPEIRTSKNFFPGQPQEFSNRLDYLQTLSVKWLLVSSVAILAAACSDPDHGVFVSNSDTSDVTSVSLGNDVAPTSLAEDVSVPTTAETARSGWTTTTSITVESTDPENTRECRRLPESEERPWIVVNDGVMGGRSQGVITTEANQMQFTGNIITEGGGFSSARRLIDRGLDESDGLQLRVHTDERQYEVLLTDVDSQAYRITYYAALETKGDSWQIVDVYFDDLEARIFGRRVDAPPFQPQKATTIGIILADGADGEFWLELDWISACSGTLS